MRPATPPRAATSTGPRARTVAGAASALTLILALAMPRAALGALGLQVTPDAGQPGATLTATATGFPPSQPVTFWWDATTLLGPPVVADGTGRAVAEIEIPAGASLGAHFVRGCQGSSCPPGSPDQFYIDDTVT
ncbi:MAG TPA: hypothetical protein VFX65_11190, partial [Candidatus Limnocylindrales bacterium]|nr:hypothetical protein [Candidatus Limnocylindrales bacterium]